MAIYHVVIAVSAQDTDSIDVRKHSVRLGAPGRDGMSCRRRDWPLRSEDNFCGGRAGTMDVTM